MMTTIFNKSQIQKPKLKEIILKNPDCLDPNLTYIAVDLNTEEGQIDILGLNSNGQVVIVNMDIEENNEALISILNQIQWVKKYKSLIKRLYSSKNVDFTMAPQAYLVSSCFSKKLRSAVEQIDIENLKLIQFTYLINENQNGIFFEDIFSTQENVEQPHLDREGISPVEVPIIEENRKGSHTPKSEEIALTPEEIAEFKDFNKTLKKEKN
jgi:hypothetical protein